jgi:hypothetical protein
MPSDTPSDPNDDIRAEVSIERTCINQIQTTTDDTHNLSHVSQGKPLCFHSLQGLFLASTKYIVGHADIFLDLIMLLV